jgi:hypothetical protein
MPKLSRTLAKNALAVNIMVWFGAALFLFAIAGEQAHTALTGQWYSILGWARICAVALGITIAGIREVKRLHARLPRSRGCLRSTCLRHLR